MTFSKNNRIENKSGQTPKCLVARIVMCIQVSCSLRGSSPFEYSNRELPLTPAKRGKGKTRGNFPAQRILFTKRLPPREIAFFSFRILQSESWLEEYTSSHSSFAGLRDLTS